VKATLEDKEVEPTVTDEEAVYVGVVWTTVVEIVAFGEVRSADAV
jgi:hypothetical protein